MRGKVPALNPDAKGSLQGKERKGKFMEELIIIIVILVLIFGFGTVQIPIGVDFPQELQAIGNITGNERLIFREKGDINLEFQGRISGNPRIDIVSERGSAYVRFRETITGNPNLEIKTYSEDVYVGFDRFIEGNPTIKIESGRNVIFANDRSTIQGYVDKNLIEINAGGRIYYGDASFFKRVRPGN